MSTEQNQWSLYIDQGWGQKKHAEKAGADQLKAQAKDLHNLASDSTGFVYYIYDQRGRLKYKSANNHNWRMRWKRMPGTETLNELKAA